MDKMNILDALIKVKKESSMDDLMKLFDEIIAYEKLSKIAAFRDLKTSETAKQKLPLLAKAYEGDYYSLALCDVAEHIINHVDHQIPEVLQISVDMSNRKQKQFEMLKKASINVVYLALEDYNHERMKDNVIGIFESDVSNDRGEKSFLIIVSQTKTYQIYEGVYKTDDDKKKKSQELSHTPYIQTEDGIQLVIDTYSNQGNNEYKFGSVTYDSKKYSIMLAATELRLISTKEVIERQIPLTMIEQNELNMAKLDVKRFANCLFQIIRKDIEDAKNGRNSDICVTND